MDSSRLRGNVRRLCGSPNVKVLPDNEIDRWLVPAVQWFAGQMKALISMDEHLGLVAEQREYPLPRGLLYFIFVEIGGNLMEPTTTWVLNSGADTTAPTAGITGQTWRTVSSGTPTRFAVEGRSLVLYPPASADFVTNNPTMTWRYLSLGPELTEQSTGISPQGITGLTDLDLNLIALETARAWLSAHLIGQKPEDLAASQAQIGMFQADIAKQLPECKRRYMDSIESSAKVMRVWTDRQGAARRWVKVRQKSHSQWRHEVLL